MDDYIPKPVRVADLQACLERWGPLCKRKSDTAFLARHRNLPVEEVLDVAMLEELRELSTAEDAGMLRELVDLFVDSAPSRITQISQALQDPERLAFHAHALRSMSLNLGAKRMVEITDRLEKSARQAKGSPAPALLNELQKAFTQTKAHLLALRGE
jgi:HPt (histidine-containing phosphotransfer) domain-containing protein